MGGRNAIFDVPSGFSQLKGIICNVVRNVKLTCMLEHSHGPSKPAFHFAQPTPLRGRITFIAETGPT